jgi:hypothetical protein
MIRKAGIMPTVFELAKKSQTYCQKEERFTVQNKLTEGSPIREQPRKARLSIRHKRLYAMKNGQVCKTRKRAGAIETDLRFVGQRKTLMNRSDKNRPKSETFHATQIPVFHEERSAVQNKKAVGGAMMGRYWQTLYEQSDTPGLRNGLRNGCAVNAVSVLRCR